MKCIMRKVYVKFLAGSFSFVAALYSSSGGRCEENLGETFILSVFSCKKIWVAIKYTCHLFISLLAGTIIALPSRS